MKKSPYNALAAALVLSFLLLFFAPRNVKAQSSSPSELVPIYEIQGDGVESPFFKQWIDTSGLVTAVTDNGYYLQDVAGDGREETSDGIFVYTQRKPTVQVGDCVALNRAYVDEYYEKTELSRAKAAAPLAGCDDGFVEPVPIPSAQLATDPTELFERYEGMLVLVDDVTGLVQGPTKRFRDGSAELAFVPEEVAAYLEDGRVFQHQLQDKTALMYVSSALGAALPELNWGDRVALGPEEGSDDALMGVLDYNFGKYQFLPLSGQTISGERLVPGPDAEPPATVPEANDETFAVCTMNLLGLGSGTAQYADESEYADQLHKRALAIAERLEGCTIIGAQEAGEPADARNLAHLLQEKFDIAYDVTAIEGPGTASFEFPLTNAVLSRADRVAVLGAELRQGCSQLNYDVKYEPGICEQGTYGLFNRPPLVVDLEVAMADGEPVRLTVIDNHWKSKGGDETVNVVRRQAQAEHVASLVQEKLTVDPAARVVILGDLNDYYRSDPVDALRTGVQPPLVHTYDFLPDLDRYTYIFNGASQVLDHILVTPSMADDLAEIRPIRINVDYAYPESVDPAKVQHSSDHDPVLVRFRPDKGAWVGGNLGYAGIDVALIDSDGDVFAASTTDDDGAVRLWNIEPGAYMLHLTPPDEVLLDQVLLPMTVAPGANWIADAGSRHGGVALGVAAALTTAALADDPVVE